MKAPCICCGDADAVVAMRLDSEADPQFKCEGCDCEFTLADVENVVEAWSAIIPWVKASPFAEVEAKTE